MTDAKEPVGGIPDIPVESLECARQLQVIPPEKTKIDPENARTVKDMFELPEPQKREALVEAVTIKFRKLRKSRF